MCRSRLRSWWDLELYDPSLVGLRCELREVVAVGTTTRTININNIIVCNRNQDNTDPYPTLPIFTPGIPRTSIPRNR